MRVDTVADDVPAATSGEQVPPFGDVYLWRHAPPWLPIVSVAPVAPMAETVSVSSAGVPFASSDHSPSLPLFFDRTRTVYSVEFVRVGIVCDSPDVTDACRLVLHSSLPDFHRTS